MLTDARRLPPDSHLDADVCIVGGGAAGITCALELEGSGLRVVVLESGGERPDAATQHLAAGDLVGEPLRVLDGHVDLDEVRLRRLGGTTNHWAGYCRRLEPVDFETRAGLAVSGWPLERADLVPWWDRAATWCRILTGDDTPGPLLERAGLPPPLVDTADVVPIAFQIAFPLPFGETYRADLAASAEIEVLLWANAVNLAVDGRRVTGVDVRTLTGNRARVTARAVVVAAGGIENARLLLASTDADPRGVANANGLVGRHFTEHLQVWAGFGVLDVDPADLVGYTGRDVVIDEGRHRGAAVGIKAGLALSSDHVRRHHTQGMEVQLVPGALPAGVPEQDEGVTAADLAALLHAETGRVPASSVYLQVLAEQRLDPESRVELAATTDALGMPRTRLRWRHGAADRAAILHGLGVLAEELGAAGLGRLQIVPGGVHADAVEHFNGELVSLYRVDLAEVDLESFPLGVGFHHMCTTRMSDDPATGVVDPDCRAHDLDNLWLAGSSVFATGGVATPTFTIVALAARLAHHLRTRLA